jgi:2-polyprenyl-3-methyl-5-hydroxy-6-metoxy-1,4-benzoquinol methylase
MYLRPIRNKGQGKGILSPLIEFIRIKNVSRYISGQRILDFGCGSSKILNFLDSDCTYTEIDKISKIIIENKTSHPQHSFLCFDLENYSFPNLGKFDSIILSAVIEHLSNPEALLKKLYLHSKKNTNLIITTRNPRFSSLIKMGIKLGLLSREAHFEHKKLYKEEIRDLLKKVN